MTSEERCEGDIREPVEMPIDIQSVDKPLLMYYLAGKTPIGVEEFAANCTTGVSGVKRALTDRFRVETKIDRTETIRLTGDARQAVIKGSRPHIKQAQKRRKQGTAYVDEGDYDDVATCFEDAAATLQVVSERFAAVHHESDDINRLIEEVKSDHDSAAKQAAKDDINYHVILADQHESEGDKEADSNPSSAMDKYRQAESDLLEAVAAAKEYNKSRLHSESTMLSIDPLSEKLATISEKLQSLGGSKTVPDDSIEDSHAESATDKPTSSEPDTEQNQDSETPENPSKTQLLSELERLAEELDKIPSSETMDSRGKYDSQQYTSVFETWDDALAAAEMDKEPDEPVDPEPNVKPPQALDSSAFENSWETIPGNSRLNGQFLARIDEIKTPQGDTKTHIITLTDRTGREVGLDVWETHDVEINWKEGMWYALSEVRGTVWETDDGTTRKRLNSTKDFEAIALGSEFDPEKHQPSAFEVTSSDNQHIDSTDQPASSSTHSPNKAKSGTENTPIKTAGSGEEEGIFEDIVSDFEDI